MKNGRILASVEPPDRKCGSAVLWDPPEATSKVPASEAERLDPTWSRLELLRSIAAVYYTSGTSGRPKGVKETHYNILNDTWAKLVAFLRELDDRQDAVQRSHTGWSGVASLFANTVF